MHPFVSKINTHASAALPAHQVPVSKCAPEDQRDSPSFLTEQSPQGRIESIALQLTKALKKGSGNWFHHQEIDFLLSSLHSLRTVYPMVILDERPIGRLYAAHRLSLLPPHIRSRMEACNPDVKASAASLPLYNQKWFFDAVPLSLRDWSAATAIELHRTLDINRTYIKLPLDRRLQLASMPTSVHRHLFSLWDLSQSELANSIIAFFRSHPQNKAAATCLSQYVDRIAIPVNALTWASDLLHSQEALFTKNILPPNVDWLAVTSLVRGNKPLLEMITCTTFSEIHAANLTIRGYLIQVAYAEATYAASLATLFAKNQELAVRFSTLFSLQECCALAPMSAWIWSLDGTENASERLLAVAKFFKYNPDLSAAAVKTLPSEDRGLIALFASRCTDFRKGNITQFSDFLKQEGREDLVSCFLGYKLPSTKEDVLASSSECGLRPWVDKLLSRYLEEEHNSQLLLKIHLIISAAKEMHPGNQAVLACFAEAFVYLAPVEKMIKLLKLSPPEGYQAISLALEKPERLPAIFLLCDKALHVPTSAPFQPLFRGIPDDYMSMLLSIECLTADHLMEALKWFWLNPAIATKWAALAKQGLIVPINTVPEVLLDKLIEDEVLRESCRYIPMAALADPIACACEVNLPGLCLLLKACSHSPEALAIFLPSLYERNPRALPRIARLRAFICRLYAGNEQDQALAGSFLFLLEKSAPPGKLMTELLTRISKLIEGGDKPLAARLLDMAKVCGAKNVLPFLEASSRQSPLTKACMPLVGSRHAKIICRLQNLAPRQNRLIRHVIGCPDVEKAASAYLPYLLNPALKPGRHVQALDALENPKQSALAHAINEALHQGNCCLAETLMVRNMLLPDVPLSLQEVLGDLKDEPEFGLPYYLLCIKLLKQGARPEEIAEFAGTVLLLAEHQRQALATLSKVPEPLEEAREQAKLTMRAVVDLAMRDVEGGAEEIIEGAFAQALSTLIVTKEGQLNRAILPLLQTLLPTLPPACLSMHAGCDFLQRVSSVCRWLTTDRLGIRHSLAGMHPPRSVAEERHRIAASFIKVKPTRTSLRRAVVGALLVRLRQANLTVSCFATAPAAESLSTYAGTVRAARDYHEIINSGALSLDAQQGQKKQFSLAQRTAPLQWGGAAGLRLTRTREAIFTQFDTGNPRELMRLSAAFFGDPSTKTAAFSRLFFTSAQNDESRWAVRCICSDVCKEFYVWASAAYDPFSGHADRASEGDVRLYFEGKAVDSPQEYLAMIETILKRICTRYVQQGSPLVAAAEMCMEAIQQKGAEVLLEITENEPCNQHMARPLVNHRMLTHTPWRLSNGGSLADVRNTYLNKRAWTNKRPHLLTTEPEMILHTLLSYGRQWPVSVHDECAESPTKLMCVSSTNHACTLRAAALLDLLGEREPSDAIRQMKEEAQKTRAMAIDGEMRARLVDALALPFQPSHIPLFRQLLSSSEEVTTLGALIDRAVAAYKEIVTDSSLPIALAYLWENNVRGFLRDGGASAPSVSFLIDLNYAASGHVNDLLGFGGSIITGGIIEFRGSPYSDAVARQYTVEETGAIVCTSHYFT